MTEKTPDEETSDAPAEIFPPDGVASITRDHVGRFVKGTSGNLNGRPRLEVQVRRLAQERGLDAIEKLAEIMRASKSERIAIAAASALLDRGFGTPRQSVDIDASVTAHAGMPGGREALRRVGADGERVTAIEAAAIYRSVMNGDMAP
jgi:hypothetical protein